MSPKYFTIIDLAERFGVTPRTIRTWIATPHVALPAPVKIGNRRFFDQQKIIEWESKNTEEKNKAA